MKILVLGAGAIGGYFGGRLVQAGADVRFLVRERRQQQLQDDGLVVRSPHGDFRLQVETVRHEQIESPADLVLLACKAYDLDDALTAIAPAMGEQTLAVPLLNGLAHIEHMQAALGVARVAGGTCGIPATLSPTGEVVQLAPLHRISFGRLPQTAPHAQQQLEELLALFQRTPVSAELEADMMRAMWEKFVGLATLAAMTCLMRGAVGDIVSTDEGAALFQETYSACEAAARGAGHPPREAATAPYRAMISDRDSKLTASMLRDLEGGGRTEGAHVVGDMLKRVRAAGLQSEVLRAAHTHLQVAERKRGGR